MTPLRMLAIATLTLVSVSAMPAGRRPATNDPDVGTVVSLRVLSASGHADVVIGVAGDVHVKDFTLADPARVVVDIEGATLGLPTGAAYDGVPRGSITNVRYSQFTHDTVRVVLTVTAAAPYHVTQETGQVRIGIDGPAGQFAAWQVGGEAMDVAQPVVATPRDQLTASASAEREPLQTPPAQRAPSDDARREVTPPVSTSVTLHVTAPQQPAPQQVQQRRGNFDFVDQPIAEVLSSFSDFSGRTILPSRNVTGTVSAHITNQPWDVALRAILNANGFDAIEDPNTGIITVETLANIAAARTTQQAEAPLQTTTTTLNYAKAVSVAPMVAQRLSRDCTHLVSTGSAGGTAGAPPAASNMEPPAAAQPAGSGVASLTCPVRGVVTPDSLTNSISITDVESALPALVTYAKTLDRRQPQVNIHAKIILVNRTALEGLGLQYDLGSQNQYFNALVPRLDSTGTPQTTPGQIALGGNTISAIANATQSIPSAALQLVYSTALGAFDLTTFIQALQQNSLLDTQAEPSGSVLNNHTLNLTAGENVPLREIDAGSGANGSGSFPQATVQMVKTGVILTVTPQVTNNGYIQMVVHVENSNVTFSGTDATAFPVQSVDNVVLVPDGGTAVMGGLTLTTITSTRTGIPLLADLPYIGGLFGVTQRQETKEDLLILITPRITDSGDQSGGSGGGQ